MRHGSDNIHSRIVAWLKIVLPLTALILLSTMFLFSDRIDPSDAVPYSDVDVEQLAREPQMGGAEYSGLTQDGAALTVWARQARPDPDTPGRGQVEAMTARLETASGLVARLAARGGAIDTARGEIELVGAVEINTSDGYRLSSDRVEGRTDASWLKSPGPVSGTGPLGRINAGAMELSPRPDDPEGTHVLVFNGGVKLIYRPKD
ncbi:hypothetical protein [Phaeovulum vinaykumarii]|uniref:Lipopolysaccharide export system protein LptC n=1 Tax=Phaeovulum vinaykumarii TaxID=407234 RepID=A0A1N7K848_9RHOB|nr:hypothetical protein [Phaeovulum vinaykumarii]SIS57759.1 lipopolysaccharide export system protein LptC [Phaeovulum vinaykumarii]SOB93546.1 lipopolysaccharide export system protein LptC [Phaeovulum vinaykumarii]